MYGFMEERFSRELTLAKRIQAAETVEDAEAVTWSDE
jgi:hypothetical protein